VANEAAVYSWYTHTCWSSQQQKCDIDWMALHSLWVSIVIVVE